MTGHPVISLEDVSKSYPAFELGPINLEVEPGLIVAVVGSNGAGKSTLFGILMGLKHPDSGNVSLFGRTYPRDEVEIKQRIGYVPEHDVGHDEMSATRLGKFVSYWYPKWNGDLYRELLGRYGVDPHKRFDKLSGGAQRYLSFALALAKGPDLLLLDEPTSGVDSFVQKEILEDTLRLVRLGSGVKTVVFATQVMEEARRIADYVTFLVDGKLLGPFEKDVLLKGWKVFWLDRKPEADVPGVVETGSPTRIVSDSPEKTREALSSRNIRIVYEESVNPEEILFHLSSRSTERHPA